MNANSGAPAPSPPSTNWSAVLAEVNAWRGASMHHFSAVEMAMTETLLALSGASSAGSSVGLRHLIGQRFDDLAKAIGPGGPFAVPGEAAFTELLQYREKHEPFRALLCHGFVNVAVDRSGRWVLIVQSLSIRGGKAERSEFVLYQAGAQEGLTALKHDGQKLTSLLGQLRKDVATA